MTRLIKLTTQIRNLIVRLHIMGVPTGTLYRLLVALRDHLVALVLEHGGEVEPQDACPPDDEECEPGNPPPGPPPPPPPPE